MPAAPWGRPWFFARRYFVPVNPNTENQERVRSYFTKGVTSWQGESPETRAMWNAAVRGRPLTGLNYYLAQYIKYLSGHNGQAPAMYFLPSGQQQS